MWKVRAVESEDVESEKNQKMHTFASRLLLAIGWAGSGASPASRRAAEASSAWSSS